MAVSALAPRLHAQATSPTGPIGEVALEFDSLAFRSIGPATMSGRIADLAVLESNPATYYVGTAHGGVWKTTNHGTTFEALFQDQGLISIGDVTISQRNPEIVWVGTGESNNRQSTSWGGGVYKSTDGGATFDFMGLADSRHIHRIAIHPENDDVVLVAATGPLSGPGGERGVYRTIDGGRTWERVLHVDEDTGANSIVFAATNPDVVFAGTYQRRRNACCMNGGGPGSGLWKSTDAGVTWSRLEGGGFPDGDLGRISVDVFSLDDQIVYALVEGPDPEDDEEEGVQGLYRSDDGGATWTRQSGTNPRPMYFSELRIDPVDPDKVWMGGVGLHLSLDGGVTFETDAARAIHDDVHAVWVDPNTPDHVLIGNDGGVAVSWDGSRTWRFLENLPAGLFYHVNYDLERPFNICGGMQDNYSWCGPSASRFRAGIMNYDWFQVRGGDGFVAMPDLNEPRVVYAESQNGNLVRRDIVTGESKGIRPTPTNVVNAAEDEPDYRWHWDTPFIRSPHDPGVLLAAAQKVFRTTDKGDSWVALSGDLTTGTDRDEIETMGVENREVRISRNDGISNWPTIVSLAESPARPGLYWTGSDDGLVHVSRDAGATWENVTPNIPGIPALSWVSEVVPSKFADGRVYVTVDGHLANDFNPYVWVSEDFGQSFRPVTRGLEGQNVRTLTEDHRNPDVLYVGTETGIFVTLDRGANWRRLRANLPTVRVDEITLHERDNAMLVATHGRAIFVLDHLEPLQEYRETMAAGGPAKLFTIPDALQWKSLDDRNDEFWGHHYFVGENPPTDAVVHLHLLEEVDDLALRIHDAAGRLLRTVEAPEDRRAPGIHTLCWDQRVEPIPPADLPEDEDGPAGPGGGFGGFGGGGEDAEIEGIPSPQPEAGFRSRDVCAGMNTPGEDGPYVTPGSYRVDLVADGRVVDSKPITIHPDPEVPLRGTARVAYDRILTDLHELRRRGTDVAGRLTRIHHALDAVEEAIDDADVPGRVEDDFETFRDDLEGMRALLGVPLQRRNRFRRFFGGGGGGNPDDALAAASGVASEISAFWAPPSDALMVRYHDARGRLTAALAEGEAILERARALSEALAESGVEFEVPESGFAGG
ncbi:MAG: hypothetical protein RQ745_01975 [Longimicrobiales bacterium]|nr:hypothetical protein [Longimicrobiales bacterium]